MSSTPPSPTVVEDVLSAPGEREQGARPPRPVDARRALSTPKRDLPRRSVVQAEEKKEVRRLLPPQVDQAGSVQPPAIP